MPLSSASSFGAPIAARRVFAAARPFGARAVLVRRSSRSFSGLVAVPRVPAGSVPSFCARFAVACGVSVLVRRGPGGVFLPSVPVAPRSRRLARPVRPAAPPWSFRWGRAPVAVAGPAAPAAGPRVRVAGRRSAWRWSARAALVARGGRFARLARVLPVPARFRRPGLLARLAARRPACSSFVGAHGAAAASRRWPGGPRRVHPAVRAGLVAGSAQLAFSFAL